MKVLQLAALFGGATAAVHSLAARNGEFSTAFAFEALVLSFRTLNPAC